MNSSVHPAPAPRHRAGRAAALTALALIAGGALSACGGGGGGSSAAASPLAPAPAAVPAPTPATDPAPDSATPATGTPTAPAASIPPSSGGSAPAPAPAALTAGLADFTLQLDYLDWLMPEVGPGADGFRYGAAPSADAAGYRHAKPEAGVAWPTSAADYAALVGADAAAALPGWGLRSVVLYGSRNADGSYSRVQDLSQGATCVDDTARAALLLADAYARAPGAELLARLRGALAFVAYLTPLSGHNYNCAWLDAPRFFTRDAFQRQNRHVMTSAELMARSSYPADFSALANDRLALPATLLRDAAGAPVRVAPWADHAPYSIVMNDLVGPDGADIAPVYRAPTWGWNGAAPVQTGWSGPLKLAHSSSAAAPSMAGLRAFWAFAHARRALTKTGNADAALNGFVDGYLRLTLAAALARAPESLSAKDGAIVIAALADVIDSVGSTGAITGLPADRAALLSHLDIRVAALLAHQETANGDTLGLFRDGDNSANWNAWGELEIYALARAHRVADAAGRARPLWLERAMLAADGFYATAFGYLAGADGTARITALSGGNRVAGDQIVYEQTPIMLGLMALALETTRSADPAISVRAVQYRDAALRVAGWLVGRNRVGQSLLDAGFPGRVRDAVAATKINTNAGGESSVEGLRALLLTRDFLAGRADW